MALPLPDHIPARCAAGDDPRVSRVGDHWVIHPADYDPAEITGEDVLRDPALRVLTVGEVEDLYRHQRTMK